MGRGKKRRKIPKTGRFEIIDSLAARTRAGRLDPATMMRLALRGGREGGLVANCVA